jgi:hypothetical protein
MQPRTNPNASIGAARTVTHHTCQDGRVISAGDRLSVREPHWRSSPSGGVVLTGTARWSMHDYPAQFSAPTYPIFVDRWGNTHVPREEDILTIEQVSK